MPVKLLFTAVKAKLKPIATDMMRRELEAHTKRFLQGVIDEAKVYPPVPADSTYPRTFNLLKSWQIVNASSGDATRYAITNDATDSRGRSYAGLVHGGPTGQGQWYFHSGRWRKVYDVLQQRGGRGQLRSGLQAIVTRNLGAV